MGTSRTPLSLEERCWQGKDHRFGIVFRAVAWWHGRVLLEGAELCRGEQWGTASLPPVCSHLISPPCCWCGCGTGVVREPLLAPLSFIVRPVARVAAKHEPWEPCS